jgi:hypothetical protein
MTEIRKPTYTGPVALVITAAVGGIVFVLTVWWLMTTNDQGSKVCDKAVAMLLNAKDLVDVYRAGVLVHEVDCRISRRAKDW